MNQIGFRSNPNSFYRWKRCSSARMPLPLVQPYEAHAIGTGVDLLLHCGLLSLPTKRVLIGHRRSGGSSQMSRQVAISHSILRQPRSFRISAIGRVALAIVFFVGICACSHSESTSSGLPRNPAVGRWQAEISNPAGRRQQCVMEVRDSGQIAYGDSCPMPLTSQTGTITTSPDATFSPSLYVPGKDSGTFMITGGGISGMAGAFRIAGEHMTTRTAPGADIEWTRSSSETPMRSAAASAVLPGQVQWPVAGVPAIAQRAIAYVHSKWQPDAFLTMIQIEPSTGISNTQSPAGGLLVQLTFYSPGQQLTLSFTPNSPAGDLIPGSSADPNDERALPASFLDLPDAVAKLRAKGLRGKMIKTVHLENYSNGSFAGSMEVSGPEWVIDSALDERGAVLAVLPDENEAKLVRPDEDPNAYDSSEETTTNSKQGPDTSGYLNGRPFFSNNANDKPK